MQRLLSKLIHSDRETAAYLVLPLISRVSGCDHSNPKVFMTARKLYNLCSDGHVQCSPLSSNAPKDSPNGVPIFENMLKEEGLRTRIKFHHTNNYLSFTKNGTLVERPHVRDGRCEFIEKQVGYYFQYEYAVLDGWMLGFSRSGNPTNGLKYLEEQNFDGCTKFIKLDSNVAEEIFK